MARLFKIFFVLFLGFAGIVAIAAVSLILFFDPNDFRDRISAEVEKSTGREFTIEGDISLRYFPWLAVDMGRVELGNAQGFGSDPFMTFEEASLSVRLLPLIFKQELAVGTADLDGLNLNLEVARNGVTNWDDLLTADDEDAGAEADGGGPSGLDVAKIRVSNANVRYTDRGAGTSYRIGNLGLETGRITGNEPVTLNAEFDFESNPGDLGGHLVMRGIGTVSEDFSVITIDGMNLSGMLDGIVEGSTEFNFDSRSITVNSNEQRAELGELDLNILDLAIAAKVEPFSYADAIRPVATISVSRFSLKELLPKLDIEAPVTADPNALSRVALNAKATVGDTSIAMTDLLLELDNSTMKGSLSVPIADGVPLKFDLNVDEILVDAYMAPTDETAAGADAAESDVQIPVELIRALNASGKLAIRKAVLTGLEFEFVELGINSADGKLRLHPVASQLYEGTYNGDVRIDASGRRTTVSVNEVVQGVKLKPLATAMFGKQNISGDIGGRFALSGAGNTLSAIRQDLDGNINVELNDGAWEGTDIWYQLRKARAVLKQQPVPEPRVPPRTEFTSVKASGTVTDGIFENRDFAAELPFLRLAGRGTVDLVKAEINYGMQVRVLEKPELMRGVGDAELADFTRAVIPLKITGPLASPSVQPDVEAMLRQEIDNAIQEKKDEIKNRVLDRLLGGQQQGQQPQQPPPAAPAEGEVPPEQAPEEPPEEESLEQQLKKKLLKDLIGR